MRAHGRLVAGTVAQDIPMLQRALDTGSSAGSGIKVRINKMAQREHWGSLRQLRGGTPDQDCCPSNERGQSSGKKEIYTLCEGRWFVPDSFFSNAVLAFDTVRNLSPSGTLLNHPSVTLLLCPKPDQRAGDVVQRCQVLVAAEPVQDGDASLRHQIYPLLACVETCQIEVRTSSLVEFVVRSNGLKINVGINIRVNSGVVVRTTARR